MAVSSLENQATRSSRYNHSRLEPQRRFLRFLIRAIGFNFLAKVDRVEGIENIPEQGPAILMINHIAFIDPIAVLHVAPRNIIPMAKVEVYDIPVLGIFPRIWHVIPVRRTEFDRRALNMAMDVLRAGEIILVAPEGTRSDQLQPAKEGVAYLASRSGAPVIPVAVSDTKGFPALRFTRRWKGPGATIRFGRPFRYRSDIERPGREMLRQMTDEAMYALARLLPEHQRGAYGDFTAATEDTIDWL